MKILLHTCCAPCSIYPADTLRGKGFAVMGFFYRQNIHPYTECMRRETAMREYADKTGMKMIFQQDYNIEDFLRKMAFRESERCRICYHDRLYETAKLARTGKFDQFTSTLLYSRQQKHALIAEIGEAVAKSVGVPFYYEDFRIGWEIGRDASIDQQIYRQQYCGCIYSEKQRYCQIDRKSNQRPG
jgi:epoxyqueuosine reductase